MSEEVKQPEPKLYKINVITGGGMIEMINVTGHTVKDALLIIKCNDGKEGIFSLNNGNNAGALVDYNSNSSGKSNIVKPDAMAISKLGKGK